MYEVLGFRVGPLRCVLSRWFFAFLQKRGAAVLTFSCFCDQFGHLGTQWDAVWPAPIWTILTTPSRLGRTARTTHLLQGKTPDTRYHVEEPVPRPLDLQDTYS